MSWSSRPKRSEGAAAVPVPAERPPLGRRPACLPAHITDLHRSLRRLAYRKLIGDLAGCSPARTTPAQQAARDSFDLEAAMKALPGLSSAAPSSGPSDGRQRLRAGLRSGLTRAELRAAAAELGAQRASAQYLDALCIVIGNQARAERFGYVLELNVRVPFTTVRTMRTILDQMRTAGVTFDQVIQLGRGRSQVVQCFGRARHPCREEDATAELERSYREGEAAAPRAPPLCPPVYMRGIPDHLVNFPRPLNDTVLRCPSKCKPALLPLTGLAGLPTVQHHAALPQS